MRGQVWVEYLIGAAVFVLAFAVLFSPPLSEVSGTIRTSVAYIEAVSRVAVQEMNAGADLYVETLRANPEANEINISGNYDASDLRTYVLNAVSALGVAEVRT